MRKILELLREGHLTIEHLNALGANLEFKGGKMLLPANFQDRFKAVTISERSGVHLLAEAVKKAEQTGLLKLTQRKRQEPSFYVVPTLWHDEMTPFLSPVGIAKSLVDSGDFSHEELNSLNHFSQGKTLRELPVNWETHLSEHAIPGNDATNLKNAVEKAMDVGLVEQKKSRRQGKPDSYVIREFWVEPLKKYFDLAKK